MSSEKNIAVCDCTVIHEETVNKVREGMPEEGVLERSADFFKVVGDRTRIRILHALFLSEMCVCDIAVLLDMNQSAISHQLRVLKQSGLVKYRREGKIVFYSLDDEHVMNILDQGLVHVSHN
ncbi:ArsR/SmtB family transcription factor [Gudongella sp. DL1XJH-153]|uniref:ArsR/SmtB family transcription factor n=1 Tax=Gudongella sp. DL1XJH-153 TaxID=3409804 RepID=UPI003BB52F3B